MIIFLDSCRSHSKGEDGACCVRSPECSVAIVWLSWKCFLWNVVINSFLLSIMHLLRLTPADSGCLTNQRNPYWYYYMFHVGSLVIGWALSVKNGYSCHYFACQDGFPIRVDAGIQGCCTACPFSNAASHMIYTGTILQAVRGYEYMFLGV